MNYAAPVFGFVILLALTDWFVRGRKFYVGPKREIDPGQAARAHDLGNISSKYAQD
jgi:hypothetical protein